MKSLVLVHGFRVRDGGARTVDRLASGLFQRGYQVDKDDADYGWHGLIRVRLFHYSAVERIAAALVDADVIIDHSNGRNYSDQAIWLAAESQPEQRWHVISISGAWGNNEAIHPCISRMDVLHTHNDRAVKVARWLRFNHPWGNIGAVGYRGADPRVHNHDYTYRVSGHSNWFEGNNIEFFAGRIDELLSER